MNKKMTNPDTLSDKERFMLMAFHDGECGMIGRWRSKRLIKRSAEAAEFCSALGDFSRGFKSTLGSSTPLLKDSLWEKISNRIEQEERAALYLGARIAQPPARRSSTVAPLGWSVAGGLVAASVTVFVFGNTQSDSMSSVPAIVEQIGGSQVAKLPIDAVNLVSQNDDLPKLIESGSARLGNESELSFASQSVNRSSRRNDARALQSSVGVDWMRSDGAVRFFSDPHQHSTTIWIKKRSPTVRFYSPPGKVITPQTNQAYTSESPRFIEQPLSRPVELGNR
jgi:hypothetical protein